MAEAYKIGDIRKDLDTGKNYECVGIIHGSFGLPDDYTWELCDISKEFDPVPETTVVEAEPEEEEIVEPVVDEKPRNNYSNYSRQNRK